ncbi:Ankyrin repeat [Evansella caseinilytica]|uniref:Ankyrin repeat n=1 Tax=Evansella caseinilytica TaxID=1503961 RepID=A0A1H3Q9H6_9BACI|nr:ankyrin repeat domain-containing protein [Evansella caseinilytica]SDZ09675.1 Ankyrin repeat [Evansella caseinilytica]
MKTNEMINEVFQAAQENAAAKLKQLLMPTPALANKENDDGLTPLGYAAHFGSKDALQVLLDYGADINAVSHSKISFIPSNTALHAALAGTRSQEVIQLLLHHGAKTDIVDSNGHTCLHTAAFHDDNTEIIRLLLEHGAPLTAKDKDGKTALELASEKGNNNAAAVLRKSALS